MSDILKGAGWAGVILLVAWTGSYGLISRASAHEMLFLLPLVAAVTMLGRGNCLRTARRRS